MKTKTTLWSALSGAMLLTVMTAPSAAPVLYDNGLTDGTNGYSNFVANTIDPTTTRYVLDDFVIPDGETWEMTDFHWTHLWNSGGANLGRGMELYFHSDNGGTPGQDFLATANVTGYTEAATGDNYFGRDEMVSDVDFDPIVLGAGSYWFEASIVGPENNFWLVQSTVNNNELWVNYSDLGGLQSGTTLFGVAADLNFQITGNLVGDPPGDVPEPGTLALLGLGLAGLGFSRRRKKA